MNTIEHIEQSFHSFITQSFAINPTSLQQGLFTINADEQKQHFGHINSNAAMTLAKELGKNPREIAQRIIAEFTHPLVEKIEIAGPGFLNFFLTTEAFKQIAHAIATHKEAFFKRSTSHTKQTYNVEFVSANPTGPLHLGHGRGGIIGDVLCNVLSFLGNPVTREFYINDAGAQIQKLGMSLHIRCQQLLGADVQLPEQAYHGEYLVTLAQACITHYGAAVLEKPASFFADYAKEHLLAQIKATLAAYGITFDVWFSEKILHTDGSIIAALELLRTKDFLYEADGALWFKSTVFGDDKDRVVRKADGELTYVAADIAYMKNKIDRGATKLIMVLGHDHHSYVIRLQALLKALALGPATLDVILYQLVKMKASGQLVRMSKRAGNIVTLSDVIDTVGVDVARFFYLNRKADAQLEFDLDLALKKTEENPVYYVQYAYVRTGSIIAKACEIGELAAINPDDSSLISQAETILLLKICSLKNLLENISSNYQTHLLTYYILELAQLFHGYYAKNRVIDPANMAQSRGRLFMIGLVRDTLATALTLLGISKPEKM